MACHQRRQFDGDVDRGKVKRRLQQLNFSVIVSRTTIDQIIYTLMHYSEFIRFFGKTFPKPPHFATGTATQRMNMPVRLIHIYINAV